MCVVSAIADDWQKRKMPGIWPMIDPFSNPPQVKPAVTREDLEQIKKELEELKKLLEAGKKQDADEGNPDCEMEEKIRILKELGELFGVNLEEVFRGSKPSSNK